MDRLREVMGRALFLADRAREAGDVPVGAVVVDSRGTIVGQGWNRRELDHDPCGHAEIVALREAGRRLGRWNLVGCTLVVTLEPCTMCAGAAVQARVDRVVFAAWDPKAGAAGSVRDVLRDSRLNHQAEVIGGVLEEEATIQLRAFFGPRRDSAPDGPAAPATEVPADAPTAVPRRSRPRPWESSGGRTSGPAPVPPSSSPWTRAAPSLPNATTRRSGPAGSAAGARTVDSPLFTEATARHPETVHGPGTDGQGIGPAAPPVRGAHAGGAAAAPDGAGPAAAAAPMPSRRDRSRRSARLAADQDSPRSPGRGDTLGTGSAGAPGSGQHVGPATGAVAPTPPAPPSSRSAQQAPDPQTDAPDQAPQPPAVSADDEIVHVRHRHQSDARH